MSTFIMLTRLSSKAVRSPQALEALEAVERQVKEGISKQCCEVRWLHGVLGPQDCLEILRPRYRDRGRGLDADSHVRVRSDRIRAATEWD